MTMTQSNSQPQQSMEPMIPQEISAIHAMNDQHLRQILDYSKGFLDKTFPLAQGSHRDVGSYVVYYQHLLAFMADGSQTGLADPSQFVALCGSKQRPQSILLRQQSGRGQSRHVELLICKSGQHGARDQAGIEDIQLEIAAEQPGQPNRWFSMMDGQLRNDKLLQCQRGGYTGKDGNDYQI